MLTAVSLNASNVTANTAGARHQQLPTSLSGEGDSTLHGGDGGGLWASSGASVAAVASHLDGNSCTRFGGAAAVLSAASLSFSGGAEASGNSALGGGAISLISAGTFAAEEALFRDNNATAGALPRLASGLLSTGGDKPDSPMRPFWI